MIFLSGDEVAPVALKPGQASLDRQLYTNEARAHEETYVAADNPKGSIYGVNHSGWTRPEDYMDVVKPFLPTEPKTAGGHHGTAHWGSEYRNSHSEAAVAGAKKHAQLGPAHRPCNPPSCVGRSEDRTGYWDDFGKPGTRPLDKLDLSSDKLPQFRTHLTRGTTKCTSHMPGYQGFLASNTTNPNVARVEQGKTLRTTYHKANLTEEFHTNLVGYSGHVPGNARNDYGGRQPTTRTVHGKDYPVHPLGVF